MDFSRLMALAGGHAEARIVQTAVSLDLFDTLASGPRTAGEIAAQLASHPLPPNCSSTPLQHWNF